MTFDIESQLLDRFLAGEATPQEAARVRAWIDASADRAKLVSSLRAQGSARHQWDVEKGWRAVQARRARAGTPAPRIRPSFVRWAAAAVVLLGLAVASWQLLPGVDGAERASLAEWRQVTVPRGKRSTVELPDGSVATLNASSRLRYRSDTHGGGDAREVFLYGEAFFVVRHDASRPFRVHIAHATIEDVGTQFVVTAWAGRAPTVVVTEGAVALHATRPTPTTRAGPADSTLLTAGMLGRLGSAGSVTTRRVDVTRYTAWTAGRLIIDDESLDDVATTLERWFDVDVRLTDPTLATRRVNADFRGESLAEVLATLAAALDLDIRRDGRHVNIAPRRATR